MAQPSIWRSSSGGDDEDDQPLPCDNPRPTYDSVDLCGVFACEGCGYYIELSPRGPLWQHYVPLIRLRPPTAEALLKILTEIQPLQAQQRRQARDVPRQWRQWRRGPH
jgi:hypothetical protein